MDDRQAQIQGVIDELAARAEDSPELRERFLSNAAQAIFEETGLRVPEHWAVVATEVDGTLEFALGCDELPDDYLEWVSGGRSGSGNIDWNNEECAFFKDCAC